MLWKRFELSKGDNESWNRCSFLEGGQERNIQDDI